MIPEAARRLIAEHIDSVEQLEILLLLREHRDMEWTAERVNERIRSSLSSVSSRLAGLERRGLLARSGAGYRYQPRPEEEVAVTELAAAYVERRFAVIDLIFAKPIDRLRVFADAFKVKGGGSDG